MIQVGGSSAICGHLDPSLSIQLLCYPQERCPCLHGQAHHGYRQTAALRKVSTSPGLWLVFWANEVHTSLPLSLRRWWRGHLATQPKGKLVMCSSWAPGNVQLESCYCGKENRLGWTMGSLCRQLPTLSLASCQAWMDSSEREDL